MTAAGPCFLVQIPETCRILTSRRVRILMGMAESSREGWAVAILCRDSGHKNQCTALSQHCNNVRGSARLLALHLWCHVCQTHWSHLHAITRHSTTMRCTYTTSIIRQVASLYYRRALSIHPLARCFSLPTEYSFHRLRTTFQS